MEMDAQDSLSPKDGQKRPREEDTLINELLESNPDFRALVMRSKASRKKPLPTSSNNVNRIGYDAETERELFLFELADPLKFADTQFPRERFVCLLIWDAGQEPDCLVSEVAAALLAKGAVYVCCWGADCERVHDAMDAADIARNPSCNPVVMTTWHDDQPLAEAIYFALNLAWPDEGYAEDCDSVIAVCIGYNGYAGSVREAFSDPAAFVARIRPDEG
jgi:hypothetical protein